MSKTQGLDSKTQFWFKGFSNLYILQSDSHFGFFFPLRTSIDSQQLGEFPASSGFKSNKSDVQAIFRSILDLKSSYRIVLAISMSAIVMWHNLCCEWEADDEVRKRLREKGAHGLLLGDKNQQTNKTCSDNSCVLVPVLARMAGTHGTPIPHIEPFRVEVQSLMEQTQSTFDEAIVDDIAWQGRKLASHVKMKVRRQEVSHESRPQ